MRFFSVPRPLSSPVATYLEKMDSIFLSTKSGKTSGSKEDIKMNLSFNDCPTISEPL